VLWLALILGLVAVACTGGGDDSGATSPSSAPSSTASLAGTVPAPEFPAGLDWLNTDRPLTMAQLQGKIVVLDFWTYGCINCMHIIPDLKQLEAEHPDELVVIGVHSAKFENESITDNIRQVILRYGLEHPVVNDRNFEVWNSWGARAWPTLALVDPAGNVVGTHAGEGAYAVLKPVISALLAEFEVDRTPLEVSLEGEGLPESLLSFPGKVLADATGGRLFVADSNNHRVVVADLATGEILDLIGSGERGYRDGGYREAAFEQPQGMALSEDGATLYVADQVNHAVRSVDLVGRAVTTLVGTGSQASQYPPLGGAIPGVELASPWDVVLADGWLYVAMAGSHQIWGVDLATGVAGPVAGSGREGVANGDVAAAELAQPSGLAIDAAGRVHFADSESSSMRFFDPETRVVGHLAGTTENLFDFGDADGVGDAARFQHPLGVAYLDGLLYVADTYNHRIRTVDPDTGATTTLAGEGRGWRDGAEPLFFEPGGIDAAGGLLYVADTNNHAVRVLDPATGEASTLVLYGIERFLDGFAGTELRLDPVAAAPGPGSFVVDIVIPGEYKTNEYAPFTLEWRVEGAVADSGEAIQIAAPDFPLTVPVEFLSGIGEVVADTTVYYCTDATEGICFIEQVRFVVPVTVVDGGVTEVTLPYEIVAPQL
jgi:DNA-binding beta-propeller fold protein YncE